MGFRILGFDYSGLRGSGRVEWVEQLVFGGSFFGIFLFGFSDIVDRVLD